MSRLARPSFDGERGLCERLVFSGVGIEKTEAHARRLGLVGSRHEHELVNFLSGKIHAVGRLEFLAWRIGSPIFVTSQNRRAHGLEIPLACHHHAEGDWIAGAGLFGIHRGLHFEFPDRTAKILRPALLGQRGNFDLDRACFDGDLARVREHAWRNHPAEIPEEVVEARRDAAGKLQAGLQRGGRDFEHSRFRGRDRGLERENDIVVAVHDLLALRNIVELLGGESLAGEVRAVTDFAADRS